MNSRANRVVTHAVSGASFAVPGTWQVVGEERAGDDVLALEPDHGQVFRINVVLTAVDNAGLGLADWQELTELSMPQVLHDYLLLDREDCEVAGGLPGGRRLAHHSADGLPLTIEQWFTQVGSVGHTLTATVPDTLYDTFARVMTAIAGTWRVPEVSG